MKQDGLTIYPESTVAHEETTYYVARQANGERCLGVRGDVRGFEGGEGDFPELFPLTAANAAELRRRLPWLKPVPLGLRTSYGFGDRLGVATPGHIAALRAADPAGQIAPIFAQQSVRENSRTGRSPQQVLDDAMWGVLQGGWQAPWGADADHVKEIAHLAPFVAAGYTFYTIDPSDYVDNEAQTADLPALRVKMDSLPWIELGSSFANMQTRYCTAPVELAGLTLTFTEEILLRALAKYGRALAHTAAIAAALTEQMGGQPFELEMSVDETDTPTSAYEHYFIANELTRLGVPVVSLAPRFVGKFQKGVDYLGDAAEFAAELAKHAAIMHHFGSYKLSIHTGSDKFSIYGQIAAASQGRAHVKTAGTSYLEALRAMAAADPAFFRRILTLSRARFDHDRKTYFLDARLDEVPAESALSDAELPGLLEQFSARQVLHVTFGSNLDTFGAEFRQFLADHEAEYAAALQAHFSRHLAPFVR